MWYIIVRLCACVYVCAWVHVCMHKYKYIHTYRVSVCVCAHVCVRRICMHIYEQVIVCVNVCMSVCICYNEIEVPGKAIHFRLIIVVFLPTTGLTLPSSSINDRKCSTIQYLLLSYIFFLLWIRCCTPPPFLTLKTKYWINNLCIHIVFLWGVYANECADLCI